MPLLLVAVSTVYAQTETAPTAATSSATATDAAVPKYGPVYQLEIKDQAAGEGFRNLKITKRFARRLPNFYGEVISDAQRDKVYEIQADYFEPIEMLTLRLERLTAERNAQIEAILSADQKAKVEKLTKESNARRTATRAANARTNANAGSN
jgi:hypothetical protein